MKTLIENKFVILLVLTIFFSSCKKLTESKFEEAESLINLPTSSSNSNSGGTYNEGDIILGSQLINPYTLSNMTNAAAGVMQKGISSNNTVDIRTTHYYVKFKPKDWDEYADLKEDTTIQLFDYPLDREIIQRGNNYHDPAIVDTLPTFQYASVKSTFDFNDTIEYEILSSLYIPEEDITLNSSNDDNQFYLDKLLDEAYILTNNYTDTIKYNSSNPQSRFTSGG